MFYFSVKYICLYALKLIMDLSLEERAICEWLSSDVSIETVAKKYNFDTKNFASIYFTRFVDAAIEYHNDKESTHHFVANNHNIPFCMYTLFFTKFKVDCYPSDEGLLKAQALKKDELYTNR